MIWQLSPCLCAVCPNGVYAAGFVEKILYIKADSNTVSFFDVKVGVKYIVYNNMYKFNTQIDRSCTSDSEVYKLKS